MSGSEPDVTTLSDALTLKSLAAGKPPVGCRSEFFFGRNDELDLLGRDLDVIGSGQCSMRFVVGAHGSGKSALLYKLMSQARRKRFVTMRVEFSRRRLLHGYAGEGRALLEHALLDMQTLGSGGTCAMDAVITGFRDRCNGLALQSGRDVLAIQAEQLAPLECLPLGLDFARVIASYMDGLDYEDEAYLAKHRRWLRAQFDTNTESRGARFPAAIADDHFWSMVKLWGMFIRLAGRPGLILVLDEARLLDEVLTTPTRNANYAEIFRIYDEIAQGLVSGIGLLIAATPAMVGSKQSKGLCSEPGLRSCLQNGECIGHPSDLIERVAFQLPELDLDSMEAMLRSVRSLIAQKAPDARLIPERDISLFIEESKDRLGGQQYPTPRDVILRFLDLHNRLAANPKLQWSDVIHQRPTDGQSVAALAAESGDYAEWSM